MFNVLMIWVACSGGDAPPAPAPEAEATPAPAAAPARDPALLEVEAVAAAESAAKAAGGALKKRLMAAMAEGGPEAAVTACADEAQGLTALALSGKKARAGRTSLRRRNVRNEGPDWVQAWLAEQGERPAAGVAGISAAHQDGDMVVGRFLAPIEVEGACLACHGAPEQIPAEVSAILAERYPNDQATGYALGDLRGALWAEVRLPVAP